MTESYPFVHGEHHVCIVHLSLHGASYHMYLQVPINSNKICPLGKDINMYSGQPPLYRLLQSGTPPTSCELYRIYIEPLPPPWSLGDPASPVLHHTGKSLFGRLNIFSPFGPGNISLPFSPFNSFKGGRKFYSPEQK
jgi:hypothetical protein